VKKRPSGAAGGPPAPPADTVQIPLDGVLDLHAFLPRDVPDLVPEYVTACQEAGVLLLRIIHGKGTGTLRRIVHAALARHPAVAQFALDANWGATVVTLHPLPGPTFPAPG
jgi:DNA-nicking Smr family endonuclease